MKQIKAKIKSTTSIKKTTRALEIVSTIKLQKLRKTAVNYRNFMNDFLSMVALVQQQTNIFSGEENNKTQKDLHIVLTSEKGLCGPMNTRLVNMALKKSPDADYIVIGKKGNDALSKQSTNIIHSQSIKDLFSYDDLEKILGILTTSIEKKTYRSITLYFNYFKTSISQIPLGLQIFPLTEHHLKEFCSVIDIPYHHHKKEIVDLTFEPSIDTLKTQIIEQFIKHITYGALLQNKAGEMASRMIAMKNAKDNASEFIKSLTLTFNKARQGAITQEISEIVGAKIAIEA